MKKGKGCLGVGCLVVIIIIAIIAVVLFTQRNNISAVITGASSSDEEIQQQITDSKKEVEQELENYNISGLRDFTLEEEEAIRKGDMTVDEAMANIMAESNIPVQPSDGQGSAPQTGASSQPSGNSGSSPAQSKQAQASAIVSEYTVRLYALKANYLGQIGNLIDQAKADHKNGMGTGALMSKYLGRAASLENEADSQVDSLLGEMKGKLNAIGADTSIVSTMKSSYENEKALKKSYYLSLFNKKK